MNTLPHIVVVGLGYVGLPLANAFAETGLYKVTGVDIDARKLEALRMGIDPNGEENPSSKLDFSIQVPPGAEYYIITVPTPVREHTNEPDLSHLINASTSVGEAIATSKKTITGEKPFVIYESTVHPGCTENECVPTLERTSFCKAGDDFFVGYSPERVSPGETHVTEIKKLVSTNNGPEALDRIFRLYQSILKHPPVVAKSIQVAEASKIFENTQRDVLIGLVNEFATLCHSIGIDVNDVIDAASTKWNFAPLRPGFVGGHCIGVDPYYLLDLAEKKSVNMQIVRHTRELNNEGVPETYATWIKGFAEARGYSSCLVVGYTFKPNVSDTRNTGVKTFARALVRRRYANNSVFKHLSVYDPKVTFTNVRQVSEELASGSDFIYFTQDYMTVGEVDMVVLAVNHKMFDEKYLYHMLTTTKAKVFVDLFGKVDPKSLPPSIEYLRY